jgi:hypothetical protein
MISAAVIVHLFVFLFTDMLYTLGNSRLLIPVAVLFIPAYACYMNAARNTAVKIIVTVLLLIPVVFSSCNTIFTVLRTGDDKNRAAAVEYLTENDYDFGYATFWNANVMTELSDGRIEAGTIGDDDFSSPYLWLTRRDYYLEGYHDGKCFLLITRSELASAEKGNKKNLSIIRQGTKIYSNDQYVICSYPDTRLFPKIDGGG